MTESVHPINHLVPELLQEIFVLCSCADGNDEGYSIPSARKAPLLLSHICGSWRRLALHTPVLWYRLHLQWNSRQWERLSLLGELWLSHCNSIPLRLSIHEYGVLDLFASRTYGFQHTGTYFALKYATRLSSLSINDYQHVLARATQIQLRNLRFPVLQHLELKGRPDIRLARLIDSVRCPQLSSYKLDLHPSPSMGPDNEINGTQSFEVLFSGTRSLSNSITQLELRKFQLSEDDLEILANMFPFLSILRISVDFMFGSESQPQKKIIFTNLRCMSLTLADPAKRLHNDTPVAAEGYERGLPASTIIFNRLFAPNLTVLEADLDDFRIQRFQDKYDITTALFDFIRHSSCSLQELSILKNIITLNDTKILEFAISIPTLRKLAYDGALDSNGYHTQNVSSHQHRGATDKHPLLRFKNNEWEFLPLLEELHCHVNAEDLRHHIDGGFSRDMYNFEENVVPDMIQAIDGRMRSSGGNRLRRCRAKVITRRLLGMNKMVSDTLDSLTELGLTYSVNSTGSRRLWSLMP